MLIHLNSIGAVNAKNESYHVILTKRVEIYSSDMKKGGGENTKECKLSFWVKKSLLQY